MLIASFVIAVTALGLAVWAILPIVFGRPRLVIDFTNVPIAYLAPEAISHMGPGDVLGATVSNRPAPAWVRRLGIRRGTSTRVAATFDIADGYTGRLIHQGMPALFLDHPDTPDGADLATLGSPTLPTRMVLVGRGGQIMFPDGGLQTLHGGLYVCVLRVRADEHDIEATSTREFNIGPDGDSWQPPR